MIYTKIWGWLISPSHTVISASRNIFLWNQFLCLSSQSSSQVSVPDDRQQKLLLNVCNLSVESYYKTQNHSEAHTATGGTDHVRKSLPQTVKRKNEAILQMCAETRSGFLGRIWNKPRQQERALFQHFTRASVSTCRRWKGAFRLFLLKGAKASICEGRTCSRNNMHLSARRCQVSLCTNHKSVSCRHGVHVSHWPACHLEASPVENGLVHYGDENQEKRNTSGISIIWHS